MYCSNMMIGGVMRNRILAAEMMEQSIKLQQMGGKITTINSKLCYVTFDLSGFKVSYVYNVNKKDRYFLERIQPYPLPLEELDSEDDVIDVIKIDLQQFKNATKSHNIDKFVSIAHNLNKTFHKFEDLFLYYNLSEENTKYFYDKVRELEQEIQKIKEESPRVYFDKEPDDL